MDFETIIRMKQQELKYATAQWLEELGYSNIVVQKGFVYAPGELPIMLVAHLDTVHKNPVEDILYSHDGTLMMSPQGIGGDDRAGVYAVLQIARNHRCHVLFCEDEEVGGRGARLFASSAIRPQLHYIVELDRRGGNDAVFYGCDNPEFTEFICGFGFREAQGSFSDISIVAPRLGVAAVNISTGYHCEHTLHEYINLVELNDVIARVAQMVAAPCDKFEYIERQTFRFLKQKTFQNLTLWDTSEQNDMSVQKKKMMFIPSSAHLRINGHIVQPDDFHLMDESGKVYHYIETLDAAIPMENTCAYSEAGLPLRFRCTRFIKVSIISYELAIDQLSIA